MPTVLRKGGYRFFFYSNDHLPKHIHVEKGDNTAKFLLDPVELVKSSGLKANEISRIRNHVIKNQELLIKQWDEYFNSN